MYGFKFKFGYGSFGGVPTDIKYINYNWSNTFQISNQMYTKNIGNSGVDLVNYAGKGTLFNSTNQSIDLSVQLALATSMIYTLNGVQTYTETPFDFSGTPAGTYKDVYYFSDTLTSTEIAKYSSNPDGFFQDVEDGVIDNCVLNMPMESFDALGNRYDYANNTTHQITNHTASCDVSNLIYGTQQTSFSKNELGLRTARSEFFEGDGISYSDTFEKIDLTKDFVIECDFWVTPSGINEAFGAGSYGDSELIFYKTNGNSVRIYFGVLNKVIGTASVRTNYKTITRWNSTDKTFEVFLNKISLGAVVSLQALTSFYSFTLGKRNGINEYWNDTIENFKVQYRTMTDEEIQAL